MSGTAAIAELLFSFSVPLAWAIWELVKLRREQARDAEKAAAEASRPETP